MDDYLLHVCLLQFHYIYLFYVYPGLIGKMSLNKELFVIENLNLPATDKIATANTVGFITTMHVALSFLSFMQYGIQMFQ